MKITNPSSKDYGKGLRVKRDINGEWCCVGDRVRLTRPAVYWEKRSVPTKRLEGMTVIMGEEKEKPEIVDLPEAIHEGVLILRISQGVMLKLDNRDVIRPKFSNRARNVWRWEKVTQ